jgi:hypothetical protein
MCMDDVHGAAKAAALVSPDTDARGRPEPLVAAPRKSRFREQVLAALLTSPTIEAAANTVGVGERTVRRWLAEQEFAEAFANARKQALDDAVLALQRATTDAVATLCRKGMRAAAKVLLMFLEAQAEDADERRAPGPLLAKPFSSR